LSFQLPPRKRCLGLRFGTKEFLEALSIVIGILAIVLSGVTGLQLAVSIAGWILTLAPIFWFLLSVDAYYRIGSKFLSIKPMSIAHQPSGWFVSILNTLPYPLYIKRICVGFPSALVGIKMSGNMKLVRRLSGMLIRGHLMQVFADPQWMDYEIHVFEGEGFLGALIGAGSIDLDCSVPNLLPYVHVSLWTEVKASDSYRLPSILGKVRLEVRPISYYAENVDLNMLIGRKIPIREKTEIGSIC
jgi:hypothetical protein